MSQTIANVNPIMWVFAVIIIGAVLLQSFLFLRFALSYNKKHNLMTKDEIKRAAITGAVAGVGPSMSNIIVALSLIVMVGSRGNLHPLRRHRRTDVRDEHRADCRQYNGSRLYLRLFTEPIFTCIFFTMTMASMPYAINLILTLKPLDMALEKTKQSAKTTSSGKTISFSSYLGSATMLTLMGYMLYTYVTSGGIQLLTAVIAGIGYFVYDKLVSHSKSNILRGLTLGVAMIIGMAAGQILTTIMA